MKRKILVVDDEPGIRESVRDYFEMCDFEVKVAVNGAEGIAFAISWRPDVVLSDFKMPIATGYEVVQTLRSTVGFQEIPIIIFSAMTDNKNKQELLEAGATYFISKPFRLPELADLVRGL